MRYQWLVFVLCGGLGAVCACSSLVMESNPFLAFTEEYGVAGQQETFEGTAAGGIEAEGVFRRDSTITFRNNHPSAELNTSLVAWVNVSSIRSAEQQDALLQDGYTQLTQEVRLGTAHVLPVGTFVYEGGGTAGATSIVLNPAEAIGGSEEEDSVVSTSTSTSLTLNTPDAVLVFSQPPVSCESVAFYFTVDGDPLTAVPVAGASAPYGGATGTGGFKTLAQVDVYECDPFRPGLFFSLGGDRQPNEYYEGEDITFDFNPMADDEGNFCTVTIGAAPEMTIETTIEATEGEGGELQQAGGP